MVFTKDVVEISEKGKSVQVSTGLDYQLTLWLVRKLKGLLEVEDKQGENRLGFCESRKGKGTDLTLKVKNIKGGGTCLYCVSRRSLPKGLSVFVFRKEAMAGAGGPYSWH